MCSNLIILYYTIYSLSINLVYTLKRKTNMLSTFSMTNQIFGIRILHFHTFIYNHTGWYSIKLNNFETAQDVDKRRVVGIAAAVIYELNSRTDLAL